MEKFTRKEAVVLRGRAMQTCVRIVEVRKARATSETEQLLKHLRTFCIPEELNANVESVAVHLNIRATTSKISCLFVNARNFPKEL